MAARLAMALCLPGAGALAAEAPLRFVGNADLPPMVWNANGEAQGVAVDLVRAAAQRAGLDIAITASNWQQAQQDLKEGRVDALIQINPNPERLAYFDFSDPLLQSSFHLFRRTSDAQIHDMASLDGRKVGVEGGGFPIAYLRKFDQVGVVVFPTWGKAFEKLEAGEIDAVFIDRWVGEYVLIQHKFRNIALVDPPVVSLDSRVAVRKGNAELLQIVNRGLQRIEQDGTRQAILDKWQAKEVVYLTRESIDHIAMLAGGGAMAVLLGLTAYLYRQRVQLRQSKERYRLLLQGQTELISRFTVDGTIRFVNEATCRLFGVDADAIVGTHWHPRVHTDDIAMVQQKLAGLTPATPVVEVENRVYSADGAVHWIHYVNRGFFDPAGNLLEVQSVGRDVSDRVQAESALQELNQDFVAFLDNTSDFIYFKDIESRFRFASQTMATLTGHAHWKDMRGKHDLEVFPPETARVYWEEEIPVFRDGTPILNKTDPYIDLQGQPGWVSTSKWPTRDAEGRICGLFGVSRIVTEQVRLEHEHMKLLAEQQAILDNELVAIMIAKGRVMTWVNPAFEKLFGYPSSELIGQPTRIGYCSDGDYQAFGVKAQGGLAAGSSFRVEWEFQRKDGSRFFADVSGSRLGSNSEEFLWCFVDVTERRHSEEQVRLLAFYDPLTQLPNRRLFADRFAQAMARSARDRLYGTLLVLDLDNFKSINDLHGHAAGDLLLQEAARRIGASVRETDTVGRFGGDEFVVILWPLAEGRKESALLATAIAEKIRLAIGEPYRIQLGTEASAAPMVQHRCTASVGTVLFLGSQQSVDSLFQEADAAMYEAKNLGRNRVQLSGGV